MVTVTPIMLKFGEVSIEGCGQGGQIEPKWTLEKKFAPCFGPLKLDN